MVDALFVALTVSKMSFGLSTIPEKAEMDPGGLAMEMVFYQMK